MHPHTTVRRLASIGLALLACSPSDFENRRQRDAAATPDAAEVSDAGREPDAQTLGRDAATDGGLNDLDGAATDAQRPFDAASDGRAGNDAELGSDASTSPPDASPADAAPCGLTRRLNPPRVTELARLGHPSVFAARVLGSSQRTVMGGSRRAWIIPSNQLAAGQTAISGTPFNYPLLAYDGPDEPWKATSEVATPWRLHEEGTDTTLPPPMLTLRTDEVTDTSLTPISLITRPDDRPGLVAFVASAVGFNGTNKVWLADVEDGRYLAVRRSTPLFEAPPYFMHAARRDGDYVHLYACSEPGDWRVQSECFAGRVHKDKIDDRTAYQVRSQRADSTWEWTSDLQAGKAVLTGVYLQLSVTYNSFLGAYLAVYGKMLRGSIFMRTAPTAFGPWSEEETEVALPPAAADWPNYNIREHASIVQRCEGRILVSYSSPTALHPNGLPATADARLVAVDLAE